MKREIGPMDWVRFMRDNRFVIGQVAYITRSVTGRVFYQTDAGEVDADSVLECRPVPNAAETPCLSCGRIGIGFGYCGSCRATKGVLATSPTQEAKP